MSPCCSANPLVSPSSIVYCCCYELFPLEETAVLISKVAASERSRGFCIDVPVEMDSMKQKVY